MDKQDNITMIKLRESTRSKLKKLKKYPRETHEDVLLRLIKKEVTWRDTKHS